MADLATLGIQVTTNADDAASKLNRLTDASKGAETATNQLGSAGKAQATVMDRLRASYDPLYAAQMKYRQALSDLKTLQNNGAVSAKQYSTMLAAQKTAFAEQVVAINKYGSAADLAGRRSGAFGGSLGQLSFQLNDIATGLAMGQSPFQIMAQQGGQVFQIWQMNNGIFSELRDLIGRLITPTRLLVGGTAAAVLVAISAANSYIQSQKRLELATKGLGAAAGATADDLRDIAEQAARTGNVSVAQAEMMEAAFVRTGKIGKENLLGLTKITKDYATQTGQSIEDATAKLANLAADPSKGIDELAASIGGVTGVTRELIQAQLAQGNQQRALAILIDGARKSLDDYRASETALGRVSDTIGIGLSDVWHDIGKNINDSYDSLTKFVTKYGELLALPAMLLPGGIGLQALFTQQPAAKQGPQQTNAAAINRAYDASKTASSGLGYDQLKSLQDEAGRQKRVMDEGFPGLSPTQAAQVTAYYHSLVGAIQSMTDANGKLITQSDIRIRQDNLAIQALNARTPAEKAAIARQQTYIALIGQNVSATQAAAMADSAAAVAYASAQKALDDQNKAITLSIQGNLALAAAYAKGDAAAMVAQAHYQALQEAITSGIDVQARERQLLAEAVSGQTASSAANVHSLQQEAQAQDEINKAILAGKLPYSQMNDAVPARVRDLQLEADRAVALALGNKELVAQIDSLIDAYHRLDKAKPANDNKAAALASIFSGQSDVDQLRTLVGMRGQAGVPQGKLNQAIGQNRVTQGLSGVDQYLGGQFGMGDQARQIKQQEQEYLNIVQDALDAELISREDAAERRRQIETQSANDINNIWANQTATYAGMLSDSFGQVADAIGQMAGKQSGVYKAMLAVSKAFAIAQATLNMEVAISNALAVPWPANIPFIAEAIADGAQIISAIGQVATSFDVGGYTGNMPRNQIAGVVHGQEFVTHASATSRNRNTLAAMNNGTSFDEMFAGGGRAANTNINITQEPGVAVEVVGVTEDEVTMIARRVVHAEAPSVVASNQRQPNSVMSKATRDTIQAKRLRR